VSKPEWRFAPPRRTFTVTSMRALENGHRFAGDQALFEIFMRLAMMNAFCHDVQSADDITQRKTAGQQHSPTT